MAVCFYVANFNFTCQFDLQGVTKQISSSIPRHLHPRKQTGHWALPSEFGPESVEEVIQKSEHSPQLSNNQQTLICVKGPRVKKQRRKQWHRNTGLKLENCSQRAASDQRMGLAGQMLVWLWYDPSQGSMQNASTYSISPKLLMSPKCSTKISLLIT